MNWLLNDVTMLIAVNAILVIIILFLGIGFWIWLAMHSFIKFISTLLQQAKEEEIRNRARLAEKLNKLLSNNSFHDDEGFNA